MAREWRVEEEARGIDGAMEAMLVEVFGCTSFGDNEMKGDFMKGKRISYRDRFVPVHEMEEMLVEIFGCTPPDHKVISFEMIKDRKRDKKDLSAELPVADVEAQRSGAMLKLA